MSDSTHYPTLLPYLGMEESRVRLDLLQPVTGVGDASSFQNPFRVLLEGSGLSRLLGAAWVTDAGSRVQDVFLVVQRDVYPWSGRDAGQLVNPTVEAIWRQTHAFCGMEASGGLMSLQEQLDSDGRLLPFQSLFYCRTKRRYFHPPCPQCGGPLMLCRDDAHLTAAQLPAYSLSLRRYLHCPSCARSGSEPIFYTFELGAYDRPCVKDRFALISEFGGTPAPVDVSLGFPCSGCDQSATCYGPSQAVSKRVLPFSFYPFHGLFFRPMPLSASELLVMISGGEIDDIREMLERQGELGRVKALEQSGVLDSQTDTFLFRGEQRFFLEVLYLKLCFLAEAIDILQRSSAMAQDVDAVATLEQLWVTLPERSAHLPRAWHFGLSLADVFHPIAGPTSHALTGTRGFLYSLGMTWLQTLLLNAGQDAARVNGALDALLDRRLSKADPSGSPPPWKLAGSVFGPENVLWRAESFVQDPAWTDLWEESLNMGWELLAASRASTRDWSWAGFGWQIDALRERVRLALFSPPAVASPDKAQQPEPSFEEASAIHAILNQIRTVWKRQLDLEQPTENIPKPPPIKSAFSAAEEDTLPLGIQWKEEEELAATVIVTGAAAADQGDIITHPTAPPPEEILPDTIILPRSGTEGKAPSHPVPPSLEAESAYSGAHPAASQTPSPPTAPRERPDAKLQDIGVTGTDEKVAEQEPSSISDEDTFTGAPDEKKPSMPEEDDLLMETIILSPRKGPDGPEKKK